MGAIRAGRLARILNGIGMRQAFCGGDVGTSSARAGVFDEKGSLLATARHPITVWHEAGGVVEQSSSEIWAACVASVRTAMVEAAISPSAVKGLGFDATCSLVVLDAVGDPLTVSASGDQRRNVIVWMDHRALAEARQVNETKDDVLRYVGGSISPTIFRFAPPDRHCVRSARWPASGIFSPTNIAGAKAISTGSASAISPR